jgi:protein-S-isoprenylcysteine O-methyltransferase Ste14
MLKNEQFAILTSVCVMAHIIRTTYEILKHKKVLIPGRGSFIIILFTMCLLWLSWFGLCNLDIYKLEMPGIFRYFGVFLLGLGLVVFITGLATIKSLESYKGDLITFGIYSIIRHPMYLGFILWLIGMPLYYGGMISLALCIVFIVNVLYWRHLEEKELEIRFPAYKDYKKTTIF